LLEKIQTVFDLLPSPPTSICQGNLGILHKTPEKNWPIHCLIIFTPASLYLVNLLVDQDIPTLLIGKNDMVKQEVNLGKANT
jgi:hypothetical protein